MARISLRTIKQLVEDNDGKFARVQDLDAGGERGFTLVFKWDDEGDSDDFVELLDGLLDALPDAVEDGDEAPPRILSREHAYEDGVLCSYLRFSVEIK
jgi:hypothetical protein